jgi:hypothetical protein
MNFVYPGFLWALTALSVPIIIHLFNFRRTTRVYFSATRFLQQVQEATSAKRRLKHYLILASRLLFVLFLVLAFAQPIIPAREQMSSMRNMVIYLDNSLSMSVPVEEKTRALDAGITMAQKITETFPADTRYRLITNDFAPFSNAYKSRAEINDLLTQVRLSPVSRSLEEITDRIQNGPQDAGDVFWISDFQQSTTGKLERLDSLRQWHLVPLTFQTYTNIFCDSAWLENPFVVGGERNTLHARLRNTGDKEVNQLLVKLSVNNIQAGASSVSIAARGATEVTFDLTTGLAGINRAVISFSDYPVSFDNDFFMALNFSDKIKVLEVKPTPAVTAIERVFGNRAMFSMRSFTVGNFNYSLLPEADLVVLHELDALDAGLQQSLRTYLEGGGTVLVIPSSQPDLASYRGLLQLPALAVAPASQSADLDYPDVRNPFFENVFEEPTTRMAMPSAHRILTWGDDRSAILRFKNEQPFLSLLARQPGKIYLMASPLQSNLSTLASNALFVPVMYRIAASGKRGQIRPYYSLAETFVTLRLDSVRSDQPLRLTGEQELIPPQRKMADQVVMELPRFSMNAGFYRVTDAPDTVAVLAFNLDQHESLLEQYTASALEAGLGAENVTFFEANSGEAFSNEIKARYLGTPLWKYAVWLALLFLMAEIVLIRFLK